MSITISLFVSGELIQKFFDSKRSTKKMSSAMPLSFNAVELCVVTINEKPWTRAKEVYEALEYGTSKTANIMRAHCRPADITQKYQIMGLVSETRLVNWPTDSKKFDIYINEEGMIQLLVGCQLRLAKEIAK